jgi:hypothetical protein
LHLDELLAGWKPHTWTLPSADLTIWTFCCVPGWPPLLAWLGMVTLPGGATPALLN